MLLQLPQPRPISLLISGPPGAGKTALACAMAKAASLPVVQLRLCDVIASSSTLTPEKKIAEEFFNSVTNGPALVLISQFDQLSKDGGGHSIRNLDKGVTRLLCTMIDNLTSEVGGDRLLVVAECSHVELLDPKLLDCFSEHISIKPPSAALRVSLLKAVCSIETLDSSVDLEHLGLRCSGFLAGDFVRLVKNARRIATKRCLQSHVAEAMKRRSLPALSIRLPNLAISSKDFTDALKLVKPTLKKEGFPTVPETTWQDVGGLKDVREELRRKMLDPIKEPDLLAKYNKTSSGILLWGPPGCGKTLLAKAVANEAGVNLLIVNGPDLLSMYQGESERAVRVVFARAASVAPCVIFFDEFDSLCPKRSKTGGESGSKSTIVNTLLTEMSGFMERSSVYVMAATNIPGILDPAVLRPGRFDTLLYVGLPDLDSREAVLRAATKNGTLPTLASDVNIRAIAEQCEHFSGADCRHLVETASTESFEELKAWRKARATQQTKPARNRSNVLQGNPSAKITPTLPEARNMTNSSAISNSPAGKEDTKFSLKTCSKEASDMIATDTDEMLEVLSRKDDEEEWETIEDEEEAASVNKVEKQNAVSIPTQPVLLGKTELYSSNFESRFSEGEYVVYARHFRAALEKVNPSVSEKERQKYEEQRRLKKFI
ncbi:ATPase AAA-type core [Trinorchestia longiramus]|nr:ATPase AAA-type core [Trinorchestia longiramus]